MKPHLLGLLHLFESGKIQRNSALLHYWHIQSADLFSGCLPVGFTRRDLKGSDILSTPIPYKTYRPALMRKNICASRLLLHHPLNFLILLHILSIYQKSISILPHILRLLSLYYTSTPQRRLSHHRMNTISSHKQIASPNPPII